MASYVIHNIVGELFLEELESRYNIKLTDEDRKNFLLGNLIVDSLSEYPSMPDNLSIEEQKEYLSKRRLKLQEEKIITHFRDPNKLNLTLRVPEDHWFADKYQELLFFDYSTLGYLFHLYTDRLFFGKLFSKTFTALDKNGNMTIYEQETTHIRIIKTGIVVPKVEFWNDLTKHSIYPDYTIMNRMLLEEFNTQFNEEDLTMFAMTNFQNPGIKEIDYTRILSVIKETYAHIIESYSEKETNLNVFDEELIKKFIRYIPLSFIYEYGHILDNYAERKLTMIFASNNKGKIKEIKSIFDNYEIKSLQEALVTIDVEENADSFYGNALKKAKEIYELTHQPVIADDSGICINALEGWPGVLTHRFAGENATDQERNQIMCDKVKALEDKSAQVICNLVYYDGENTIVGVGILEGTIVSPRGTNGFGFDPIFELNTGKTLAELTSEEKNLSSARYLAALDLKKKLDITKKKVID